MAESTNRFRNFDRARRRIIDQKIEKMNQPRERPQLPVETPTKKGKTLGEGLAGMGDMALSGVGLGSLTASPIEGDGSLTQRMQGGSGMDKGSAVKGAVGGDKITTPQLPTPETPTVAVTKPTTSPSSPTITPSADELTYQAIADARKIRKTEGAYESVPNVEYGPTPYDAPRTDSPGATRGFMESPTNNTFTDANYPTGNTRSRPTGDSLGGGIDFGGNIIDNPLVQQFNARVARQRRARDASAAKYEQDKLREEFIATAEEIANPDTFVDDARARNKAMNLPPRQRGAFLANYEKSKRASIDSQLDALGSAYGMTREMRGDLTDERISEIKAGADIAESQIAAQDAARGRSLQEREIFRKEQKDYNQVQQDLERLGFDIGKEEFDQAIRLKRYGSGGLEEAKLALQQAGLDIEDASRMDRTGINLINSLIALEDMNKGISPEKKKVMEEVAKRYGLLGEF